MVSSKHFVNDPNELVRDSLKGLVKSNDHLKLDEEEKVVYVKNVDQVKKEQVTLLCGGGAGHEPSHAGFVGPAMLTAAVSGHVFASPSSSQVLSCIQRVYSPEHGTLVVVKNYTGDVLNFGRAIERFKASQMHTGNSNCKISMVVVGDDVGVVDQEEEVDVGRRGLAGTILVYKIAGSAAAMGESFEKVEALAKHAAENSFTVGCALDPASVPGRGLPRTLEENQIEFGMGIHNEPGFKLTNLSSAHDMVSSIVSHITSSKLFTEASKKAGGKKVVMLVNNLGALSNLELGLVTKEALDCASQCGLNVVRTFQGACMTGLAMNGISITFLLVPSCEEEGKEVLKYLDYPAYTPGWKNMITVPDASEKTEAEMQQIKATASKVQEKSASIAGEDSVLWSEIITSVYNNVQKEEPEITRLDTVMGDGDCGEVLLSGAKSVFDALKAGELPTDSPATTMMKISNLVEASMGGTSGVIYCLFFDGVAQSLTKVLASGPQHVTKDQWADALINGLETIQRYSTARVGDRTIIDALSPLVFEYKKSGDLNKALEAAKIGAEETKEMKPKRGRAVYVGNSGKGVPDAGAVGVCAVVSGIANVFN
ncbi:Dihydroxyacetone kinase 1 [Zancudomyces culisetae]|uniref:Dihydroxyacetone kinase 1 n=1 Tax=Zancudomyces culisetae TaxID=1213189 RepID=A0A1R1PMS0_ZANCU|nr:Dihydroxyacetone kinase 1 [Zancudomyces culisetae]|eukprot:OMH82260.1 Dihydroxyacetone kinase 1 [Zancudomyces culisetae]